MFRYRVMAAGLALLAMASLPPAARGAAPQENAVVTCTNPASGASWQVRIDYGRSTVDANPAKITPAAISWFDPTDGANYTLDRRTGALTASVASSTGGYFRQARCALGQSR